MESIRFVFKNSLRKLVLALSKKNVIAGAMLGSIIILKQSVGYLRYSGSHTVNILEPYILSYSGIGTALSILIGAIIVCADAPFIDDSSFMQIHRTGRGTWYKSCWVYIILILFFYYLLLAGISIFPILKNGYTQNEWSQTILNIMGEGNDRSSKYGLFSPSKTISPLSPLFAFIFTFFDSYLYSVFLISILFVFNMLNTNRAVGTALIVCIHLFAYFLTFTDSIFPLIVKKLSLIRNAYFPIEYNAYVSSPIFSVIFFILLIYLVYLTGEKFLPMVDYYVK